MNVEKEIIQEALKLRVDTAEKLNAIKRHVLRSAKGTKKIPNTAVLLQAYHKLLKENKIKRSEQLEKVLTKRAVRTLSGVSIITVLTKPFPCPGECIYCPNEKTMPKSYLADEPAAARALALHFDPYEQVARRVSALEANGHPTDKIELIVKGGTWNAHPLEYQYWFILRCFMACDFLPHTSILSSLRKQGSNAPQKEKKIPAFAGMTTSELKKQLIKTQQRNERAPHRIVGLTLETRPDHINEQNILIMRELGCTRIELGVQTIDNKILKLIKRGHDAKEIARATALLKNYGFKVDYHLMPQLPGSTPKKDLRMLEEIFSNSEYRPDMIKIYPCTVVDNSELYEWLKAKKYKPYSDRNLIEVIKKFKAQIPRYVRVSRVIRDIPAHHIKAGNTMTNLRQVIQAEMAKEGLKCKCLRCREVGHIQTNFQLPISNFQLRLYIEKYKASGGTEYFLSFENPKRQVVYAFCRLRVNTPVIPPYLVGGIQKNKTLDSRFSQRDPFGTQNDNLYPAYIRELHVYGQSLSIGAQNKKASQHQGLGKKLIIEAEKICRKNKIKTVAVISGVGVRDYYRHLGYGLQNTYMIKTIATTNKSLPLP